MRNTLETLCHCLSWSQWLVVNGGGLVGEMANLNVAGVVLPGTSLQYTRRGEAYNAVSCKRILDHSCLTSRLASKTLITQVPNPGGDPKGRGSVSTFQLLTEEEAGRTPTWETWPMALSTTSSMASRVHWMENGSSPTGGLLRSLNTLYLSASSSICDLRISIARGD
jgi:hypothetical protein